MLTCKRVQQVALVVVHAVHGCHQLPPKAQGDLISAQEVLHCTQVIDSLLHWRFKHWRAQMLQLSWADSACCPDHTDNLWARRTSQNISSITCTCTWTGVSPNSLDARMGWARAGAALCSPGGSSQLI